MGNPVQVEPGTNGTYGPFGMFCEVVVRDGVARLQLPDSVRYHLAADGVLYALTPLRQPEIPEA